MGSALKWGFSIGIAALSAIGIIEVGCRLLGVGETLAEKAGKRLGKKLGKRLKTKPSAEEEFYAEADAEAEAE